VNTRLKTTVALAVMSVFVCVLNPQSAEAGKKRKPKAPKIATGPMDDGTLDPFWFGEGLEFREADEIDYLWVKDGFSLEGATLHFAAWPEPVFLGDDAEKRDEKDHELAASMAADLAETFAGVFGAELADQHVTTSLTDGDILVEGRIVDCSTGSKAAKVLVGFGAGSGNTTIDLRFKDAASGELLVGMHHRVVSGTTWSTTDSKFTKWVEELAENIKKKGVGTLYAKGDPTNK